VGLAGVLGIVAWLPYIIFRLHKPVPHPESAWLGELVKNFGTVSSIAPMTCLAFLTRRFFNNDFADWTSPDNQHAVWQGKWVGLESFVDQATLGLGWACVILFILAWLRGGKLRWTVLRLAVVFVVFAIFIGVVWSSARSNPLDYTNSLIGSERITGGRYLYPALMSWFVASVVLLVRAAPEPPIVPFEQREKPHPVKPKRRAR